MIMLIPLLALFNLHGFLLQAQGLPISPLPWFFVTMAVALLAIIVAAAIYMLAPVLNSSAMQQWSRFQIYEAVLSIALIILFLGVVKLLFLNPQAGFASAGLVPNGCTQATSIYSLSTCDLAQFNNASYGVAEYMWAFVFFKALIPSSQFSIQPTPQEGTGLEFQFSIPSIMDAANTRWINLLMGFILTALLLSQLELILLSSSLLLLSFFFTIGLIARIFGISRSFGGAMIAFGIGLGIIYPLLVGITYGYIDVSANTYCLQMVGTLPAIGSSIITTVPAQLSCWAGTATATSSFGGALFTFLVSPFSLIGSVLTSPLQTLAVAMATVFKEVGYVLAGLTVIPIINIVIVDVFIVDFSRAVGEQMSFSMLFKGMV